MSTRKQRNQLAAALGLLERHLGPGGSDTISLAVTAVSDQFGVPMQDLFAAINAQMPRPATSTLRTVMDFSLLTREQRGQVVGAAKRAAISQSAQAIAA